MSTKTLELTLSSPSAISDRLGPVTGGIPFPRGALHRGDGVRLYDSRGSEMPVQTEILATWDPAGREVRWLLVDFQVARLGPGKTCFRLNYGPGVAAAKRAVPVDPSDCSWPPETVANSLYMVDHRGTRYRTVWDSQPPLLQTETSGPLRTVVLARVWLADQDRNRLCRAILRLHYYAGLDQVRVFHSFVMDANPEEVRLRGIGLEFSLPPHERAEVVLSGEQDAREAVRAAGPIDLLQDRHDHYSLSGSMTCDGRRNGTWMCVGGEHRSTAVFLRNGWEEFPKRLRWDGCKLDVQLWPTEGCPMLDLSAIPGPIINATTEEELRKGLAEHPEASVSLYRFVTKGQTDWTADTVVPLMEEARRLEAELLPGRHAYYYLVFGCNGRGSMKTHELVLAAVPPGVEERELLEMADQVRVPPVLSPSPEWNCATQAFGPQIPFGVSEFADVDRAMTFDEFEATGEVIESHRLYGARDFGDYINGNPAMSGPLHRVYGPDSEVRITDRIGWNNQESHDSTVGAWLQFLRTDDSRVFYRAEATTEHLAAVDQRHLFPSPDRHLAVTLYHTLRHHDGGDAPSHTLNSGLLLGYYVTGNRGWREVALANADYFLDAQQKQGTGWYAGPSPSRQNTAPMTCVLNAYTLTWDGKYLDSLDRFLAVWAPVYDVTNPGHYVGGTLPYPGAEFARLVEHPAFRRAFHKMMDDLRTKMPFDGQSAYYMPGMVYMWQVTGDASYLAYCKFCFDWCSHSLKARGCSDMVGRTVFGLPDFPYGMISGYLAAGLAGIAEAGSQGIDLDAATEELRSDRARAMGVPLEDGLYYSVYGTVEGSPGRWYPF